MATMTRRRSGFGEILRRELDEQGVSVRELARRLTVEQPEKLENMRRSLGRYISGEVSPGQSARETIAEALSVDHEIFAEEAVHTARREKLLDALAPLADVLLELAIEVASDRSKGE